MSFSSTVLHNQPIPVKALDVQIFRSDPEKQMVTGASHPVWNSFIIAGIKLENDQGRFLLLPCVGSWAETKAYGIRVLGEGLVAGTRYTMTPYVKVVDPATGDAEYLYDEPESFTNE